MDTKAYGSGESDRGRRSGTDLNTAATLKMLQYSAQFDVSAIPVLGTILGDLASKIGGLIEKAENAGEVLIASAGAQVAAAIEYGRTAYLDALNTTIDHITNEQKRFLDDITTEIGYIEHHVLDKVREIVERGSMTLNALPFSNHFPQLGWYTPSYVAPGNSESVVIEFNGNFFDSARPGFDPTMVVNGHTFTAATKTTLKLGFSIPTAVFQAKPNDIVSVVLTVTVPYRKGIFHTRDNAEFSALITVLPPNAGQIVFTTDHLETRRFTQPNESGVFKQESTDDDIPDPIGSGKVSLAPATPGFFLNPRDVALRVIGAEGDWTDFGNRSNVTTAAWSIATRHHSIGTSGKVHFKLTWTEYQDRQVHVPQSESAELSWGSSRAFEVPPGGTWSAKYTDFRGKVFDVGSAGFENPFLKVNTSGRSVLLVTVP